MLKVFLVEDECVVREGIRDNIDWNSEGFIFCGEAADGELAYPLIQREKPDIIITDIRMPFMDGLELSQLIRNEMPQSRIIILSGYGEFAYAQKALKLGITEYILKPVSGAELLASVKAVAEKIKLERKEEKENASRYMREMKEEEADSKRRMFDEIVSGALPVAKILERSKQLNTELSAPFFQIVLFKYHLGADNETNYAEDILDINESVNQICAHSDGITFFDRAIEGNALIINADSLEELTARREELIASIEAIFSKFNGLHYFGGIGKPVERLTLLSESFENASRSFSLRFILGKNAFVDDEEMNYMRKAGGELAFSDIQLISEIKLQKVEAFLRSGNKRDIPFFTDEFLKSIGENSLDSLLFRQYIVMDIYFTSVMVLKEIVNARELSQQFVMRPENLEAIATGKTKVKDYIISIFNTVIEKRDEQRNNNYLLMILRAKEYIAAHYADEGISLGSVAQYVNISPNYFSALFSRETGQSMVRYIIEYRMNKAKELLLRTNMLSSEIGAAVGYKDPHYFSFMFKKMQNCSPTQYRASQKAAEEE